MDVSAFLEGVALVTHVAHGAPRKSDMESMRRKMERDAARKSNGYLQKRHRRRSRSRSRKRARRDGSLRRRGRVSHDRVLHRRSSSPRRRRLSSKRKLPSHNSRSQSNRPRKAQQMAFIDLFKQTRVVSAQ